MVLIEEVKAWGGHPMGVLRKTRKVTMGCCGQESRVARGSLSAPHVEKQRGVLVYLNWGQESRDDSFE